MKTNQTTAERASRVILAVLVGILVWATAINQESFPVEYRLPLGISLPAGHVLLESSADSVTVRYNGNGWEMLSFQIGIGPSEAGTDFHPGEGTKYPLITDLQVTAAVTDPEGPVALASVIPSQISIKVDTTVSRSVPVAPVFSDGVPARFRLVTVSPEHVTVMGPASLVLLIDSVHTHPVLPGTEPVSASLAFREDMVAYSVDSVKVSVHVPLIPVQSRVVQTSGLLTP